MSHRLLATTLLGSLSLIVSAGAAPVPMIDVPALTAAADVIVVGRANRVDVRPDGTEVVTITVDRVLKGAGSGRAGLVSVTLSPARAPMQTVQRRQYGIYFLRQAAMGGGHVAVDPSHVVLVASPDPDGAPAADPLVGVTRELSRVFTTPAATLTHPQTGLQVMPNGTPADQMQQIGLAAAAAMRTVPYRTAGDEIARLAASERLDARLWAFDCLLFMGDSDDLERLKAQRLDAIRDVLIKPPRDLVPVVAAVANALDGHIKAPEAVTGLTALLSSSDVGIRRSAASVLGDIGSPSAVEALATKALGDPDRRVRYHAVVGLAAANESSMAPSLDQFERRESEFVGHWRSWSQTTLGR